MTKEKVKFTNVSLDLNTLQKTDDEGIHIVMDYEYDPKADCPKFKRFLSEVLPDEEARLEVQKFFGAMFFDGARRLGKVLVLVGAGCNGKSVLISTMERVLGLGHVSQFCPSELRNHTRCSGNVHLANGRLMNVCNDISKNTLGSGAFKSYVSGDSIVAKQLYKDSYIAEELPLLVMMMNTIFRVGGGSRRAVCINFPVTIPESDRNPNLVSELCMEKAGIFNWIMEGRNG